MIGTIQVQDFSVWLWRLAFVVAVILLPSCSSDTRTWVTLHELSKRSSIPVTIEGTYRKAALTDDTVHYSEWAYGPFQTDQPIELTPAYQTDDSLVVVTPYGYLAIDVLSIRLFVGPYYSRTFGPENESIAPFAVSHLIKKSGETLSIQEFLLQPKMTYFARVAKDSVGLGGPYRTILEISSRPFDGRRQLPPTPGTR